MSISPQYANAMISLSNCSNTDLNEALVEAKGDVAKLERELEKAKSERGENTEINAEIDALKERLSKIEAKLIELEKHNAENSDNVGFIRLANLNGTVFKMAIEQDSLE